MDIVEVKQDEWSIESQEEVSSIVMRREMMKEGYEYERMNNDKNDICK